MTQTNSHIWKNLWWAYFILLALVLVRSLFSIHSSLDAVSAVFNGLGLIGLWGYLRGVAIGWRMLWSIYLALFVISMIFGIAGTALFAAKSGSVVSYSMFVALILLAIPQCLALWRYAFRSRAIWQAAQVAA